MTFAFCTRSEVSYSDYVTQSSMFLMPPSLICTDISQEPAALIVAYPADGCHRLQYKLVTTYQTARRHIPEDHPLHIHILFQMLANSKLPCCLLCKFLYFIKYFMCDFFYGHNIIYIYKHVGNL